MKLWLLLLFTLSNVPLWACNIPESELIIRVAIIKTDLTEQMGLREQVFGPHFEEGNISKKEFQRLIDSVKRVYVPIFKKQRMNFKIEHLWEDKQVNAFAGVKGSDRYILLYGGYARHKLMTKDAYLSVVCHEIGHHLGGFPRKTNNGWSSSEGQADYFSTLKCMKEVLRRDSENQEMANKLALVLPEEVQKQCKFQFPDINDYNICLRSAKAAEEHGIVIADMKGENTAVSLMTPSLEHDSSTNLKHPSSQCRADTKFQGALCNVSTSVPLDLHDEVKGACHFNNFNILGNRPSCWFVHKK
jgi:hypothetical protein